MSVKTLLISPLGSFTLTGFPLIARQADGNESLLRLPNTLRYPTHAGSCQKRRCLFSPSVQRTIKAQQAGLLSKCYDDVDIARLSAINAFLAQAKMIYYNISGTDSGTLTVVRCRFTTVAVDDFMTLIINIYLQYRNFL